VVALALDAVVVDAALEVAGVVEAGGVGGAVAADVIAAGLVVGAPAPVAPLDVQAAVRSTRTAQAPRMDREYGAVTVPSRRFA
jgi:hypothetical protein